jgi:hypothetical protein
MGFIEGGTAVLFAIVIYALYYGITGMQVYKALVADEEPITRVLWFVGIAFVSMMVWALVGGFVYWGILIWFRIWLRQPHAWHQQILSTTGWFPFGLILRYGRFPTGGIRGLVIFGGYPVVLLIVAGIVALVLRVRSVFEQDAPHAGARTSVRAKEGT